MIGAVLLVSCDKDDNNNDDNDDDMISEVLSEEIVLTANRNAGSISFINAVDNTVVTTLSIPDAEPMYVNYVAAQDKIYVGDRAQSVVHVIDPTTREVTGQIAVGDGIFHMWPTNSGSQLWVNSDVDNTTSVIDLATETVIQTIDLGGKPHDVFFNADDSKAYISIIVGDMNVPDELHSYDADTYEIITTAIVADDPHVFYLNSLNILYSPNQTGGLFVLDEDLDIIDNITLDGAHGIFSVNDSDIFVADLPGAELYKLDSRTNEIVGDPVATAVTTPHNLTINAANEKLFVTHSGADNDKVTVYDISGEFFELTDTITVQSNPFGISYYKRDL